MELNFPPSPTPPQPQPQPPVGSGYQNASQATTTASDVQPATNTTAVEVEVAPAPLIPVKRRRIHLGRLLILLIVLAALGTGLFYAGSYLYERFFTEPASTSSTPQSTEPFTYTGLIANQPFLFSYPTDWKVSQNTTGFTVFPTQTTFKSEGKDVPGYSVEFVSLGRPLSSEQLAKAYIATSFKVIISQSATSVGLAIPSYVVVTTHESLTFSTLRNGTLYMVLTQPVLDTLEDRIAAKKAAQLFMSSVRFEE